MPRLRTVAALFAALMLAGCATGSTTAEPETRATAPAEPDAFPVTITHAFGETTIERQPERVATLGWSDQDHALALGVAPVGATKLTWGGNEAGSSDWFDAALKKAGLPAPTHGGAASRCAPEARVRTAR